MFHSTDFPTSHFWLQDFICLWWDNPGDLHWPAVAFETNEYIMSVQTFNAPLLNMRESYTHHHSLNYLFISIHQYNFNFDQWHTPRTCSSMSWCPRYLQGAYKYPWPIWTTQAGTLLWRASTRLSRPERNSLSQSATMAALLCCGTIKAIFIHKAKLQHFLAQLFTPMLMSVSTVISHVWQFWFNGTTRTDFTSSLHRHARLNNFSGYVV